MKINVKGPIVSNDDKWIYSLFGIEATSPSDIEDKLNEAPNESVEVVINSGGGSVYDASEIYTALRSHGAEVNTKIVGLAASAASVIAMAGKKTSMSPTSKMMIHNAATIAAGDYHAMDKTSELLQKTNQSISNAYRMKSGLSEEELLNMMDEETWFTPQDAKEKGLIDEIMFENEVPKMVASSGVQNTLPQEVIDTIRNNKEVVETPKKSKGENEKEFTQKITIDVEESEGFKAMMAELSDVKKKLEALEEKQNTNKKHEEPKEKTNLSRFLF